MPTLWCPNVGRRANVRDVRTTTMIRVYMAARFSRREELRSYAALLEQVPSVYLVAARWLTPDDADQGDNWKHDIETSRRWAEHDIQDIASCDLFMLFTGAGINRGGHLVKYGMALVFGKRIAIIGPLENTFQMLAGNPPHAVGGIREIDHFDTFEAWKTHSSERLAPAPATDDPTP